MAVKTVREDISSVFAALGDKNRLKLYKILLKEKEICVSSLAEIVQITPAGASQHLKILETAKLIKRKRSGQKVCYYVNNESPDVKMINKIVERG